MPSDDDAVDAPWWKTSVVYQIYPRSFADSDGDGIGDLGGVIDHLDHLAALGIDVLWLSPIYPSPQDDNGYDISDYQDVDPLFGTLDQFDALVERAHAEGIRIVMDLVVNHTSDEHPWFVESRSAVDSPRRDWYWWRREPNNWRSFFGGSAWEQDEGSGEYYLHLFSRKQPDLNWDNPAVRETVYAMMRWWLDRGVDGFRMDVINMIAKDPALPDAPAAAGELGDPLPFLGWPGSVHDYLQEMHREVFEDRPDAVLTVGEMPGATVEEARLFTDAARHELDMVFQFEHVSLDQGTSKWDLRPLRLRELKASLGRWQEGLADAGWNSLYWNNHDQPRAVSRFGDDSEEHRVPSAKALATALHLHRGTPYVYQGEELAMTNAPFPTIESFRDIEALNHYASAVDAGADEEAILAALRRHGRDSARTPMQWTDGPQAGFTSARPWIDVNPNYVTVNAAACRADPDSVFHHYRRLIEMRRTDPVVAFGDFTMLVPDHEQVYAFVRRLDGAPSALLVVANLSSGPVEIDPAALTAVPPDGWELVLATRDERSSVEPGEGLGLGPWDARIYRIT